MYNITFQQIETFLTVSKYLNLTKAADVLFTTQPAISKTLRRFEEGVGMKLFTGSNQGIALTSDGAYLYSVLEPLYGTIDKSIQHAQYISTTPIKVLRIVEPSSYDYMQDFDQLKDIVKRYEAKYPEVKIHETLCDFKELRHALEFGNADIVFTEDFGVRGIAGISMRHISRFEMCIAISAKHPLAQTEELDLSALNGEIVFTLPTMSDKQEDIDMQLSTCCQLGFTPKRIEFLPNFTSIIHSLNKGKGICICTKLKRLGLDIKYFPVKLPTNTYISVAWRSGKPNRELQNFINMLPAKPVEVENDFVYAAVQA